MKPVTAQDSPPTQGTQAQFRETRWTVVLAAANPASPSSGEALANLCQAYWYPLYAFARRSGVSPHDAADLTQAFFARMLEKDALRHVDRDKGKFRSFLLASLKNFLHNEWEKGQAQKRGGGQDIFSLDELAAEERYRHEPSDAASPEKLYDLEWGLSLVHQIVEQLRVKYERGGKAALFKILQPYLTGEVPDGQLPEIAARAGLKPNTLKSVLHRLRRDEFAALLREQVRHTLANPTEQDVREEIRHLFATVAI